MLLSLLAPLTRLLGADVQACVMYRESKNQTKRAVRGAIVLAVVSALLLLANFGLVFSVVSMLKVRAQQPC